MIGTSSGDAGSLIMADRHEPYRRCNEAGQPDLLIQPGMMEGVDDRGSDGHGAERGTHRGGVVVDDVEVVSASVCRESLDGLDPSVAKLLERRLAEDDVPTPPASRNRPTRPV